MLTEQLGIDTEDGTLPEGPQLLLSSDFYSVYQSLGRCDGVDNLLPPSRRQRPTRRPT